MTIEKCLIQIVGSLITICILVIITRKLRKNK